VWKRAKRCVEENFAGLFRHFCAMLKKISLRSRSNLLVVVGTGAVGRSMIPVALGLIDSRKLCLMDLDWAILLRGFSTLLLIRKACCPLG
jgi:hypothetical protein